MRAQAAGGLLCGAVVLALAVLLSPERAPGQGASETTTIGHSVEGKPIVAERFGDPSAQRVVLVVGVIHGDERVGLRVVQELRDDGAPDGVQLWLIDSVNPDGSGVGARRNANRVDLNRNFPYRWRGGVPISSGYYPGPSPASEPETKAVMEFVRLIRPDLSVWYHQPWGAVLACRGKPKLAARYAKLVKMRSSCRGNRLRGTAISWENAEVGGTAFVVEFGAGGISQGTARRHARAVATISADE